MCQNFEIQILAKKENFYLRAREAAISRYRKQRIWQCQLKKETVIVSNSCAKFRKYGNKRDMKAIQGCWKRIRLANEKGGGKARRKVVVKPLPHQMLLVRWLMTLFQRQWIHWKINACKWNRSPPRCVTRKWRCVSSVAGVWKPMPKLKQSKSLF